MSRKVFELPLGEKRLLVIQSDSELELKELVEIAGGKGWAFYAEGRVPNTNQYGVWMLKPLEKS
jgi:hypothetical protein